MPLRNRGGTFCIIENPAIVAGFREVIHLNSKKTSVNMKLRDDTCN